MCDLSGLQSIREEETQLGFIKDVESSCRPVDLVLYTLKMDTAMLLNQDDEQIFQLSCSLGSEFWELCVFVLTFLDQSVHMSTEDQKHYFISQWKRYLPQALMNISSRPCPNNGEVVSISNETVNNIPIVPVYFGHTFQVTIPL